MPAVALSCRLIVAAVMAVPLCLALAPAAGASSIAFVRDGDVFLATPDGAREHRVTTGGGFSEVTQADDGTIVADRSGALHRMDAQGRELNPAFTPTGVPLGIKLSPDGTKVAYWNSGGVRFTDSGQHNAGYANVSGTNPNWLSNERVAYPSNSCFYTTGTAQGTGDTWFCDSDTADDGTTWILYAFDVTRAGDRLAVARQLYSGGDWQLRYYAMNGPPPAEPTAKCNLGTGGAEPLSPSWAPDGSALAYEQPDGVHVQPTPDLETCADPGGEFTIAGGRSPDWGPADVPIAGPGRGGEGPLQVATTPRGQKIRTALKKGVKLRVVCSVACDASGVLRYKRKVVARGSRALSSGRGTMVLKFTARGKKAIKRLRKVKLGLALSAVDDQGAANTATGSVTLRR
jgi:hypothetical protein